MLYAYTPEILPAKSRGTRNALIATTYQILGIMALTVAIRANPEIAASVHSSGALSIAIGILTVARPLEP